MSFLKGLLWFLFAVALVAVAMYATGHFELADRFTWLFLEVQPWLPLTVDFDQFLVGLTVLSLLVVGIMVAGCAAVLMVMGGRAGAAYQRSVGQMGAARREVQHVTDQHHRQYEDLLGLGQLLAKRLDKRVLIQAIVQAASRMASASQTNSIVSCWLLHFESETFRFETGLYCDQTFFTQAVFQPTDPPFSTVIADQQPWLLERWDAGLAIIKREKAPQLGSATGVMVVPLVIENSVLGILLLLVHPDVLKSYAQQQPFFLAFWGELTLALAIAIQGEVAILDRLTGVHNREYFMKRLIQEIERADRFQLPLSLLMIDIDDFKQVNDTLGHPQGDAVLRIISKLLKKEVRAIDLAGRYGGEEFIVMLPETGYGGDETASASGALVVAERIRKAVEEEFRGMQKPLNLTVSVGLAVRRFPEDRGMDYRDLIRVTDEQLYRAKTTGKNKVCALVPENPQAVS